MHKILEWVVTTPLNSNIRPMARRTHTKTNTWPLPEGWPTPVKCMQRVDTTPMAQIRLTTPLSRIKDHLRPIPNMIPRMDTLRHLLVHFPHSLPTPVLYLLCRQTQVTCLPSLLIRPMQVSIRRPLSKRIISRQALGTGNQLMTSTASPRLDTTQSRLINLQQHIKTTGPTPPLHHR
jgi:hypothetical protein